MYIKFCVLFHKNHLSFQMFSSDSFLKHVIQESFREKNLAQKCSEFHFYGNQ